ncbi:MAG: hypothetical protein ACI8XM_000231 [Haloarculaceae archaeon]|jgi:hypothetical protein
MHPAPHPCQRFDVFDEDWHRIAIGVKFPSAIHIVEWVRDHFEPAERTDHPVRSHYQSQADAEQATGGTIIYEDPASPSLEGANGD